MTVRQESIMTRLSSMSPYHTEYLYYIGCPYDRIHPSRSYMIKTIHIIQKEIIFITEIINITETIHIINTIYILHRLSILERLSILQSLQIFQRLSILK